MLTGELLLYRFKGGKYQIRIVDVNDPDLLLLARELISCFVSAADRKLSRNQLEEELELFRRRNDLKTADGLIKLLMDRAVFAETAGGDFQALRRRIFEENFAGSPRTPEEEEHLRQKLVHLCGGLQDIYADLPGFETFLEFPPLQAEELLRRYNLSLAQGMLFYARTLTVKVTDPDPAELRRMFKYLKFFRLLARIISVRAASAEFEISGPFSLFGTTRKYALNLALFFPAVVRLKKWKITAELSIGGRSGRFILDESAGLVSHYRNFSAHVPEEIKLFHRHFAEKVDDWKIIGETPVLFAGKQEFIIPDISFESPGGHVCHLELFHRWHRTQLEQRLETIGGGELPLIAGIDRSIMPNEEFDTLLEKNPLLKTRLFRFSDFPGVETVYRLLKKQKSAN